MNEIFKKENISYIGVVSARKKEKRKSSETWDDL